MSTNLIGENDICNVYYNAGREMLAAQRRWEVSTNDQLIKMSIASKPWW